MSFRHLDLPDDQVEKILHLLNELLASYQVHFQRLRGFHWNLKGHYFFYLHEEFEKLYEDAYEKIDEIAERVTTLGGQAISGMGACLEVSVLDDNNDFPNTETMMKIVLEDQLQLIVKMRELIGVCSEAGDEGSVDLMGGMLSSLEKQAWMVRSWLNQNNA